MTRTGEDSQRAIAFPEYAPPHYSAHARRWYRLAVLFGAAPLVSGVSILFAFVITNSEYLPVFGMLTIVVGLLGFAAGFGCLAEFRHRCRADACDKCGVRRRLVLAHLLLWSNFPAAVACAVAGLRLIERRMPAWW
jgi:hypothetical protein